MQFYRSVLAAAVGTVLGLASPVWAFECPEPPTAGAQDVIPKSQESIAQLSNQLGAGDLENRVEVIARELKQQYPQASRAELTNFMVTAYCPVVASDQGLSDSEKQARLDRFGDQVRQIYADARG